MTTFAVKNLFVLEARKTNKSSAIETFVAHKNQKGDSKHNV